MAGLRLRSRGLIRALRIVRRLEAGERLLLAPLAADYGVTTRTIRRDFAAIEEAGYPLRTDAISHGGAEPGIWWFLR